MCEQDHQAFLKQVVPKIAAKLDIDPKNVSYELLKPDESFYFSNMLFLNLIINDSKEKKTISLVVKRPPVDEFVRDMLECDLQFHNEIMFYEKFAKGHQDLPRCYYTKEKPPTDSVIVMENISQRGFGLSEHKFDIPLEYTIAAFKEIARFHAKSYVMKETNRNRFFDVINDIQETRFGPNSIFEIVLKGTCTRSIDYLRNHNHDKNLCDKLEKQILVQLKNLKATIKPEEPLATLCHGDFTVNNTFFKREDGQLKAMFIDFALMRYATPAIDLSTFLCLHCNKDIDNNLLENILKVYHDSLTSYLKEHDIEDKKKYSYEAVHKDFQKRGLFGFYIASFFLAMVMGESHNISFEIMKSNLEHHCQQLKQLGGDKISEILAKLLLNLRKFGCLDNTD